MAPNEKVMSACVCTCLRVEVTDYVLALGEGSMSICGACLFILCVSSICSFLIVWVCRNAWVCDPTTPCLFHHIERVGAFCVCSWVCVSCPYPQFRCEGTRAAPVFPGVGGSRTCRGIAKEPLPHFHPTCDLVNCLLLPTVGSLGSPMPSLCLPPITE